MWRVLVESLSYVSFICVVSLVSFLNRNSEEFLQAKHLRQLFLNPNNSTYSLAEMTTINEYWQWLQESFVNRIIVDQWYNGQPDNTSVGYLSDRTNRLIGWATMRQLRIKSNSCKIKSSVQSFTPVCYDEYSASDEEKRSFLPGWTTSATRNYSSSIKLAFTYQTSAQLDTYIYIGQLATYRSGGYVYEFRGSLSKLRTDLSQLHQLQWIDSQTRAVLIQLNLYNPSIKVLTSALIIVEILPSSAGFTSARFEPVDLYPFRTTFQIVCVCIYFIFIVCFMVMEVRSFIRLKKLHFRQVWAYIELGIIVCSWTGLGIHVWRAKETSRIVRLFRDTHGDVYLNFQLLAYINDTFSFLLGFCCFFGSLRLLRLCRYNQRLNLLSNTLKRASRELFSFTMMFSVVFMAFLTLFYLQFNASIWECSTLLHTAQMLFEMLLLKFDATQIENASSFLGPFYFSLFVLFVVFVCINMFVSIVNDNFRCVRADAYKVHSDYEGFLELVVKLIRRWCGISRTNVVAAAATEEQGKIISVEEFNNPLKRLSTRLDRLSSLISRRYGISMPRPKYKRTIFISS